jgi:hypothetical protein
LDAATIAGAAEDCELVDVVVRMLLEDDDDGDAEIVVLVVLEVVVTSGFGTVLLYP